MNDKVSIESLEGSIYFSCAACTSVYADTLSWANANKDRVVKYPHVASNIVIASCQVTDLAILNDIRIAEGYHGDYKNSKIFITGCLAERDDIELPEFITRIAQPRKAYQPIEDFELVYFEKPFWVPKFKEAGGSLDDGHLFRNHYPLRIGKGCKFNCTYCTIKKTRGIYEKYSSLEPSMVDEFVKHDKVLLIADSPDDDQIKEWGQLAIDYGKKISIRNIEPQVAMKCIDILVELAEKQLLEVFHCPIQSVDIETLKDMNRNVKATYGVIGLAQKLRLMGVVIATNIIIEYKDFHYDVDAIKELYDYVSWNPYFDYYFGN